MLLRRLTTHVRSQNWFAVGLDFIVVVAGIFVGSQADAWNAERKDRVRERATLEQLYSDFSTNGVQITSMVDFHADKVDELTFTMDLITRGELAADEVRRFRNAFVSMYQLPPLGATMGGYDAMIASGDFALIQDQKLKSMLVQLHADLEAEASLLNYFRDLNQHGMELTRDIVLVVPNDDRSNAQLQVDFEAVKKDLRILTIVAGQRRNHQIFQNFRQDIAVAFADTRAHIGQLLSKQEPLSP